MGRRGWFVCLLVCWLVLLGCSAEPVEPDPTRPFKTSIPKPTAVPATPTVPLPTPTRRPPPPGLPRQAVLGDAWIRPADGMTMRYVPGGTFQMGSAETDPMVQEDEIPQHTVTLSSFWIDQTEVTNAQFARCVEAGACWPPFKPALDKHQGYYEDQAYADYPVINVTWEHARDYCNWAGATLPTEAQWEYAARGPENWIYPWGNGPPDETLLNYNRLMSDTTPVGVYPEGVSWCGGLDMAGNVWEWTADWYRTYSPEPQTDPVGPDRGIGHVLRGGSWYDDETFVRAANRYVVREAYRDYITPLAYGFGVGFRCAVPLGE